MNHYTCKHCEYYTRYNNEPYCTMDEEIITIKNSNDCVNFNLSFGKYLDLVSLLDSSKIPYKLWRWQ